MSNSNMKCLLVIAVLSCLVATFSCEDPPPPPPAGPEGHGGRHHKFFALMRDLCSGNLTADGQQQVEGLFKHMSCMDAEIAKIDTYKSWQDCMTKAGAMSDKPKTMDEAKAKCSKMPKGLPTAEQKAEWMKKHEAKKSCGMPLTKEQFMVAREKCKS